MKVLDRFSSGTFNPRWVTVGSCRGNLLQPLQTAGLPMLGSFFKHALYAVFPVQSRPPVSSTRGHSAKRSSETLTFARVPITVRPVFPMADFNNLQLTPARFPVRWVQKHTFDARVALCAVCVCVCRFDRILLAPNAKPRQGS